MSKLEGLSVKPDGLGHALYDHRLAVPMYQRSYAWKEDHVRELFQDYARAIRDDSEYFLGTIVVAKQANGERPEIVDGQQRLATTTILLAAIRDQFLLMNDDEGAGIIETKYLLSKDLRDREAVPHLRLNQFDGDFFAKAVLHRPGSVDSNEKPTRESHRRIAAAARIAHSHVSDFLATLDEKDYAEELNRWVTFIHEKAQVIWLTVVDYEDAYVIFETLNDRGLELSIADLLKNYLFWKSGNRVAEVQANWVLMTGILETVSDEEVGANYIHQLWSSYYGVTRKRELFREVRKQITNKQSSVDLVKKLVDSAKLYAALRNPDHEFWSAYGTRVRECLRELAELRVWQIRTLLLAMLAKFEVNDAKKIFPLAVSWTVRFLVGGGSPGNIESHYARQAMRVRNGEITDAKSLAKAMAGLVPDDAAFETSFSVYKVSADYLARYYLRRLNDFVGSTEDSLPARANDESEITLEHIYPKNREPGTWSHISEEQGEEILRRLGNMALVRAVPNSKLGNAEYAIKKPVLSKEPLPLTKDVAQISPPWNLQTVEAQQRRLAALAVKAWKVTL